MVCGIMSVRNNILLRKQHSNENFDFERMGDVDNNVRIKQNFHRISQF